VGVSERGTVMKGEKEVGREKGEGGGKEEIIQRTRDEKRNSGGTQEKGARKKG